MTRIKGKLPQKCCRCGWILKQHGRYRYCTNATCYYNVHAHKSEKQSGS